jgi:hypothetical protein
MSKLADTHRPPMSEDFFADPLSARELVARLIEEEKQRPLSQETPRFVLVSIL